ncbi:MAG: hypothetical protein ABR973_14675 [Candidatus Acidiferrales bacterium]
MVTWEHHAGEATSTVALINGFVSLAVLNVVILMTLYSRRKRLGEDTSRGFVTSAVGLALLSGLLTTAGVYSIPERNDYVELALSSIPLDQIHPERKALVIELMRRRIAESRDYEHVAAQMKPVSPPLFSPNSFASENIIRSSLEQLKKSNSVDLAYHEQQERTTNEFRSKMMKVDPDYLRSFDAGLHEQEAREAKALDLEQQYVAATLALYGYADTHTRDIVVKDGQLRFANDSVRTEFSRQLESSKSLYQQWQETFQELARQQQQTRKQVGLGPTL